jgi:secondary thiamine-phosphate synthase enzyme
MTIYKMNIDTADKTEFIEITSEVQEIVASSGVKDGVCYIFVPHTTAAITINEHADPDVIEDIIARLEVLAPENLRYRHIEGNSPGHIKTSLLGTSQLVFIENGKLVLGKWQGIFFCEFDGPRARNIMVKITGS